MLCTSLSMPVSAETTELTIPEDDIAGGVVDEDCGQFTWFIDKDGKLTVTGRGDFDANPSVSTPGRIPWYDYRESILTADVNITDMMNAANLFADCSNLTEVDISGFDTAEVTDMSSMFQGCTSLESLNLSGVDTGNVTDMQYMFDGCTSLESLDLSGFETENVKQMGYMFRGCSAITELDLANFDTSKVTTMQYMFEGCSSLETLDLSSFYSHQFLNVNQMFLNCSSLKVLDMRNFDFTDNQRFGEKLFQGCLALQQIEVPTSCGKMIELPKNSPTDVWKKPDGTVIEVLPMNLETSITIKKTEGKTVVITDVFSDVYEDWYTEYVEYVYTHFLMSGIAGTKEFQPNVNITKAQVAQVLYNMRNKPSVQGDYRVVYELNDVYRSEWYIDAVAWAYNEQIVTGDSNTKMFYPNADVTREQLALMMYRYAKYTGLDTSKTNDLAGLKNAENVSNWAEEGVRWAVGSGLISGIEKNGIKDLAPQGNATRAQMAAILKRFCE